MSVLKGPVEGLMQEARTAQLEMELQVKEQELQSLKVCFLTTRAVRIMWKAGHSTSSDVLPQQKDDMGLKGAGQVASPL